MQDLAAEQVERLHAVGALVDAGDLRVPEILLDAGLADESRAAVQLRGQVRASIAPSVSIDLTTGTSSAAASPRQLRRLRILREIGGVFEIRLVSERPPASVSARSVSSIRRTSGCTHDRVGGALRRLGPARRAPSSRSKA